MIRVWSALLNAAPHSAQARTSSDHLWGTPSSSGRAHANAGRLKVIGHGSGDPACTARAGEVPASCPLGYPVTRSCLPGIDLSGAAEEPSSTGSCCRHLGESERSLVDGPPVDREARRQPHPAVATETPGPTARRSDPQAGSQRGPSVRPGAAGAPRRASRHPADADPAVLRGESRRFRIVLKTSRFTCGRQYWSTASSMSSTPGVNETKR